MDIGNLKPYDWLLVAAGAAMLVFGLALDWARAPSELGGVGGGGDPFDFFFTGGIAWLLVCATAVVALLVAAKVIREDIAPWNLIFLAATTVATLLMTLRLILGGGKVGGFGFSVTLDRGPGMFFAFIAAAAALGGAVWRFLDSGGDLKDLTNPERIRSSFTRSGE